MTLGKFHPVTVPVLGRDRGHRGPAAARTARRWALRARSNGEKSRERWRLWRAEKASVAHEDLRPRRGLGRASSRRLTHAVPEDAILAVDVGNNTYSFGRYFECARQSVLMSGYLGSIGFGVSRGAGRLGCHAGGRPALPRPQGGFDLRGRRLRSVHGRAHDRGEVRMNITHVLLNNDELGKISKEQRAGGWDVWQTIAVQPELRRLRGALRGVGTARHPTGGSRRRARTGPRPPRAFPGRDRHGRSAGLAIRAPVGARASDRSGADACAPAFPGTGSAPRCFEVSKRAIRRLATSAKPTEPCGGKLEGGDNP